MVPDYRFWVGPYRFTVFKNSCNTKVAFNHCDGDSHTRIMYIYIYMYTYNAIWNAYTLCRGQTGFIMFRHISSPTCPKQRLTRLGLHHQTLHRACHCVGGRISGATAACMPEISRDMTSGWQIQSLANSMQLKLRSGDLRLEDLIWNSLLSLSACVSAFVGWSA